MTICLYIYYKNELWVFENTYVSAKNVYDEDSIKVVLNGDFYDKYSNNKIYDLIHKNVLWISGKPGDIIETDLISFWFKTNDEAKAKRLLTNHQFKRKFYEKHFTSCRL